MVFLVPYDGSDLAKRALDRAAAFAKDDAIVALTVVPSGRYYAEMKGWADPTTPVEEIQSRLEVEVHEIAPDAECEFVRTESRPPAAKIAKIIRRQAAAHDASVVFLGSDHAGRRMSPVSSIGPSVISDASYDVYIARVGAAETDGKNSET